MILDEEGGGVPAIEGDGSATSIEGANAPYEDWLRQFFYPHSAPNTKRTSHERFVHASGVRSENPSSPDLAQ